MDRVFVGLLLIFAGISTLASPIRVGFLLDLEVAPANINSPQQSTWADFKAQLETNDGTVTNSTPIEVTNFWSTNMTSDPTELATQVDVFVLSWGFYTFYAYDFNFNALSTICDWVNKGGAVIYHGYYFALPGRAWDATWQNYTGPFLQCVPTTGYNASLMNYWGGGQWGWYNPTTLQLTETTEGIVSGLPSTWNSTIMSQYLTGAPALAENSTSFSSYVVSNEMNCCAAPANNSVIVTGRYGAGKTAFLGFPFTVGNYADSQLSRIRAGTPADTLIRQTIKWAITPSSVGTTATGTTTSSSSSSDAQLLHACAPIVTMLLFLAFFVL